jgi:predicted kinase
MAYSQPTLIVIGGYPGSGKTSIARRLAVDLQLPRLSSDAIAQTIGASPGLQGQNINATWTAYDVAFDLCAEFIQARVSTILDLNMGWAFQWQRLDELRMQIPVLRCAIMILRCARTVCHARIQQRHGLDAPGDAAEPFATEPRFLELWQFLEQLNRPDIQSIDAARPFDAVYHDVRQRLISSSP